MKHFDSNDRICRHMVRDVVHIIRGEASVLGVHP